MHASGGDGGVVREQEVWAPPGDILNRRNSREYQHAPHPLPRVNLASVQMLEMACRGKKKLLASKVLLILRSYTIPYTIGRW